jgi:hypothetical protein
MTSYYVSQLISEQALQLMNRETHAEDKGAYNSHGPVSDLAAKESFAPKL